MKKLHKTKHLHTTGIDGALQYSASTTVVLSAVQWSEVQCSLVQYCSVQSSLLQRSAVQRNTVQCRLFGIGETICTLQEIQ